VHLTLDLGGQARFGPDVEWLPEGTASAADTATLDYTVDASRHAAFVAAIHRYWPGLPAERLQPAYAGIRPKLCYPEQPATAFTDFDLCGPSQHGVPGLVHLFGIESPGLTSCLPLAEAVISELLGG
jgi:L-2-hydroxyglutarate oxidase LhgO